MNKRKSIAFVLVWLLLVSILASCAGSTSDSTQSNGGSSSDKSGTGTTNPVILRLHHNAAPGQPLDDAANMLAEEVKEKTGGRVEIQTFGSSTLGSDVAARDMMVEGSLDMSLMGVGIVSNWAGAISLLQIPYIMQGAEELEALYASDFAQKYFYGPFLSEQNVRLLDIWMSTDRELLSKKPVNDISDFKGMKLRIPSGMPAREAAWTTIGTMTLALGMDEVLTGLQTGVCDAVEGTLDGLYAYQFCEEAKELTMTAHTCYSLFALINENSFQKLSTEDQEILMECVESVGTDFEEASRQEFDEFLQKMQDEFGVNVSYLTPETRQQIDEAVSPLYEEFMDTWGQEAYEDLNAFFAEYRANS